MTHQISLMDLKSLISSKLFFNGEKEEPDIIKYLEIQLSMSKSMIAFYLNCGEFHDLDDFYDTGCYLL